MDVLVNDFQLDKVVELIKKYSFQTIILQFVDEYLGISVNIYRYIVSNISSEITVFITGDSSFGSSADDVSAMHADGDLLIYFGSDLSSSSSIPLLIVSKQKQVPDLDGLYNKIVSYQQSLDSSSEHQAMSTIVLYDPAYHRELSQWIENLSSSSSSSSVVGKIILADLPITADFHVWNPSATCKSISKSIATNESHQIDTISIGGLTIKHHDKNHHNEMNIESGRMTGWNVWYIGDKSEQLISISIQMSQQEMICYEVSHDKLYTIKGDTLREYRERYGGIAKVKDSTAIGILIGSMGLSGDVTKQIIDRLSQLIDAANKKYLVFVMGKLNESKLCNFPDVDLFCLITNEDVAMIKPKTFHVPVITPWELEIGLGAREWDSCYHLDIQTLLGNGKEDFDKAIEKVRVYNAEEKNSDSEEEEEKEEKEEEKEEDNNTDEKKQAIVVKNSANELIEMRQNVFIDRFNTREYKGLDPTIDPNEVSLEIQQGLFGIAQSYATMKDDGNN